MILGVQLKKAMISGANNILKYKKEVNELNIFPVPDGDTGTNMSMTIGAGIEALERQNEEEPAVSEVAKTMASAMLRGARGNSGVILSLLFRGFSRGMVNCAEADAETIVKSLEIGVEDAYKAVMNPTEGTMLTVARVAAEKGREALNTETDPVQIWDEICIGAREALDTTPDLLPVLKRAGVVDAGGEGVCLIFEGMMSVFKNGLVIESGKTAEERAEETEEFFRNVAAEFDAEITFTYCTEYIIGRDPEVLTDPLELRAYLETIGDCVVVVDDEEIIKTHVHTEEPGLAIQEALKFGQLLTVKIDNMKEQHRKASEENAARGMAAKPAEKQALAPQEPVNDSGFVSIAAGNGIRDLFTDLGCDIVVSGGQTMNPSTEDILEAILATPAKVVYVLPNNKNILLAAEQTVPLVHDREIVIIPTKTIPQGLSAMLAFQPEMDIETNKEEMQAAAANVQTGDVTFAARESEFDGHKINFGDILGLCNGKLSFVEKDPVAACMKVTKSMLKKTTSFVTLIYGNDITLEQAEAAKKYILSKARSAEVNLVEGKQPLYHFIVSVE